LVVQKFLSYDLLEQHENINCKYLTKKCRKCEQIVLVNDIKQHQNTCKPIVIQCPLCQYSVKTELFERLQQHETILSTRSDFIGIEIFNQSRKKTCLIRLYAMFKLILSNLPIIHIISINIFMLIQL